MPEPLKFGSHFGTELSDAKVHQWWDSARAGLRMSTLAAVRDTIPDHPSEETLQLMAARSWRGLPKDWKYVIRRHYHKMNKKSESEPENPTKKLDLSDVFHKYHNRMLGWAWKITKNTDAAEDVVQNIYLYLVDKDIPVQDRPEAAYFLRTMTKQRALDWLRSDRVQSGYPKSQTSQETKELALLVQMAHDMSSQAKNIPSPSDVAHTAEIRDIVHQAVDKLGDTRAGQLMRMHLKGMSTQAMADEIGITSHGVTAQLAFAREKIAAYIARVWKKTIRPEESTLDPFGGASPDEVYMSGLEDWWEHKTDTDRHEILRRLGYTEPIAVVNSGVPHFGFLPKDIQRALSGWFDELHIDPVFDDEADNYIDDELGVYDMDHEDYVDDRPTDKPATQLDDKGDEFFL